MSADGGVRPSVEPPALAPPPPLAAPTRRGAWHGEAQAMRRAGASVRAICEQLGKSDTAVRYALDSNGGRDTRLSRTFASPENPPQGPSRRKRAGIILAKRAVSFSEPWRARPIRQVIAPPAERLEAARAFAAGLIDRAELSRRLGSGAHV